MTGEGVWPSDCDVGVWSESGCRTSATFLLRCCSAGGPRNRPMTAKSQARVLRCYQLTYSARPAKVHSKSCYRSLDRTGNRSVRFISQRGHFMVGRLYQLVPHRGRPGAPNITSGSHFRRVRLRPPPYNSPRIFVTTTRSRVRCSFGSAMPAGVPPFGAPQLCDVSLRLR
jgi:hypothetical protein